MVGKKPNPFNKQIQNKYTQNTEKGILAGMYGHVYLRGNRGDYLGMFKSDYESVLEDSEF